MSSAWLLPEHIADVLPNEARRIEELRRTLLDAARALARRPDHPVAVMAILHDLNLAACYADHLVVMKRGRIAAQGPVRDILDEALLAEVFGVRPALSRHGGLPVILPQARLAAGA